MRILPSWSTVMKVKGRVDGAVDDGDIQLVDVGDHIPVADGCAAQRIHADAEARRGDFVQVDHVAQVADVGRGEIVLGGWWKP